MYCLSVRWLTSLIPAPLHKALYNPLAAACPRSRLRQLVLPLRRLRDAESRLLGGGIAAQKHAFATAVDLRPEGLRRIPTVTNDTIIAAMSSIGFQPRQQMGVAQKLALGSLLHPFQALPDQIVALLQRTPTALND